MSPEQFPIGVLARQASVNVETIRFYQRKGLLAEPERPYGGVRLYSAADVARVKFVKSAQRLGFNLEEVAQLLRLDDGTHCREAADLAAARLTDYLEAHATELAACAGGVSAGCGE